MVKMGN